MKNKEITGTLGEQLIARFFDSHYSKFFSFPNPKTKSNAEVSDVLVWMNRLVFLIEVKTREEGTAPIDSWVRSRIQDAVVQIEVNYNRLKNNETINLHNPYYHTTLDCMGIKRIVGLIVLIYNGKCNMLPTHAVPDIYERELPIHVLSWNDLIQLTNEIDTVPDLLYYLNDRFECLKSADIPLDTELNVLGYYKIHSNNFPNKPINFGEEPYWDVYQNTLAKSISKRSLHNKYSEWIDKIESVFSEQRKLFDGYPLGLYFAWELGAISRRVRAYIGQKLDTVQDWFMKGKSSRRFALLNRMTGNWIVFYFSKSKPGALHKELYRMVELKIIKEIEDEGFKSGVYGFGFQVSSDSPPRLIGLASAIIVGADVVKGKYTTKDLEEAYHQFGPKGVRQKIRVDEYPA